MIEVNQVSKIYGTGSLAYRALHEVDLEVAPGEVVVLVGPSGSGKTTLLSILGCVLSPSAGSVRLMGQEVAGVPETKLPDLRLRMVGFVFQTHNLIEALPVIENVRLPLVLRGRSRKQAGREAAELLDSVGLSDKLERLPRDLSGGQKQRVAIARALAGRPPILLADEPTASLDAATGAQVMETFTGLAHQRGHTVVVVTHDSRIFKYGDRLVHIEDGRIQEEAHGIA
ncbi:MAG TPA: ABC transporter ATP-binding protein [Polyangia bacterium]|nr:ABC transporter ATP-binding protein [Polyangia bacterium]